MATTLVRAARFHSKSIMPLLDAVARANTDSVYIDHRTAFFGVQHILHTNIPLFEHLIESLGANPQSIFVSGKGYSDSPEAEQYLRDSVGINYCKLSSMHVLPGQYQNSLRAHLREAWSHFSEYVNTNNINKVVVFDDGGHCFETMPNEMWRQCSMVGIEQTRAGLYQASVNSLPFPLVSVASSAAKRMLESPLISEALLRKLGNLLCSAQHRITPTTVLGVVGASGAIGSQLVQYLLLKNYNVVSFDLNNTLGTPLDQHSGRHCQVTTLEKLVERADFIFGCTGQNVFEGHDNKRFLSRLGADKTFVNCASEDTEFRQLLQSSRMRQCNDDEEHNPSFRTDTGATVTVLNRGFPVNFDHSGESVPAEKIQVTRALMLGAFQQALQIANDEKSSVDCRHTTLDAALQRYVAQMFRECLPRGSLLSPREWANFNDLRWIEANSGGIPGRRVLHKNSILK